MPTTPEPSKGAQTMLSTMTLTNFRRHVNTELNFSDDAQIIAIVGRNGAGKSTILEALTYAFYGEGRHGRRNLSRMVRRGAEHEGMQVEVGFKVGDVTYDLIRRHEKGKTSASLMANGNVIMQSPDGVTAEIVKIFSMDAAGFRLSVIAQQFDVDGLADLTPARRKQTITRLLRQDAITRAKGLAADEKNRQLSIVRAMGEGPDLEGLASELDGVITDVEASATALADSNAALAVLDRELAETSSTRSAWQAAQIAVARADATLSASSAEVERLSREIDSIVVADEPAPPPTPLARLTADLSQVNIAIAGAESARQMAQVAAQTRADLVEIDAGLERVATSLNGDTPASLAMSSSESRSTLKTAETALTAARDAQRAAVAERLAPAGELTSLRSRRARSADLGPICDSCEQPISEEHRQVQHEAHEAHEAALTADLRRIDTAIATLDRSVREAEDALVAARAEDNRITARTTAVEAALAQRKELTQRREAYVARLERFGDMEPVNLDALYSRKRDIETARVAAERFEQQRAARIAAVEARGRVADQLNDAVARHEDAQQARRDAEPGADLVEAHERLAHLEARRNDEQEMVSALRTEMAKATERRTSVEKLIAVAQEQAARIQSVRAGADRAAKTARLLDVVAERMATQIRPALEGAISDALNRLSEGRFTAVELSDSYEITVFDDGKYEPISELSGGERVLVALATRLALAQVVAGRHADGGIGLLVLDEVFGSQDGERREAIMGALRALRAEYGQILLISHVGGLEDIADHVVDVSLTADDGHRVAEVRVL